MVRLSELDPSSFSRPDECIVTHLHLDVDVDFVECKLRGSVKIGVRKVIASAEQLVSVRRRTIVHEHVFNANSIIAQFHTTSNGYFRQYGEDGVGCGLAQP